MDIVFISMLFILIGFAIIFFRKWNMEQNIIPYVKDIWKYEPNKSYLKILELVQIVLGIVAVSVGLLILFINFTKL
jgi:hypothetical protein